MTIKVPANIDRPSTLIMGLNGRQVAILAPTAFLIMVVWQRLVDTVAIPILIIATVPVAVIAVALALGVIDGQSIDSLLLAALRHPRQPLAATQSSEHVLRSAQTIEDVGHLRGPVRSVSAKGVIDLGSAGQARAIDVGTLSFDLCSEGERIDLVGLVAQGLRALDVPCQLLVTSRPVDLSGHIRAVVNRAESDPSSALTSAANDYARWLGSTVRQARLLTREVTVVVRGPNADSVDRAIDQVVALADALGVQARPLEGHELAVRIRASIDPYGTPVRRAES